MGLGSELKLIFGHLRKKMAVKWPQDGPKRAQGGPKEAGRTPRGAQDSPQEGPRWPQDGPRWGQDGITERKMRENKAKKGQKQKPSKT